MWIWYIKRVSSHSKPYPRFIQKDKYANYPFKTRILAWKNARKPSQAIVNDENNKFLGESLCGEILAILCLIILKKYY